MNATKCLEYEQPSILNEVIQACNEEEVIDQHRFTFAQLLLCTVKVKVDVQALEELSDWITVRVRFLTE